MFIPRHPVIENQFCSYSEQTDTSTGIGAAIAYAGAVVYLDSSADNEEPMVKKMAYSGSPYTPFGFLMQKVKTDYHQVHPTGYMLTGDLGSSDAIAQPKYNASGTITGTKSVPVGVAHLGIWDTVHYTCAGSGGDGDGYGTVSTKMSPGSALYAAAEDARVTNSTVDADSTDYDGERCSETVVARVVKGASVAKCQANIDNTTLYPIRIKLMI